MSIVNSPQNQERVVRVFVSSTFRDMQGERDELVKFIFPQLRKLCEKRGVAWGQVDLRWGITEEQKAEGQVLPICLKEIKRCRPYFIGILGERYGWVPDKLPRELIEQESWLAEHYDHSVTELEILHGVLNSPDMAKHAYFYFRDPKYAEQSKEYNESATDDEIRKYGQEEASKRSGQRKEKLEALKGRIEESGFPLRKGYSDPKAFGKAVLEDLTAVINELYPEGSQPDTLDREAMEHEIYAKSRANVYIWRKEYYDKLDKHAISDDQPLTVLGESGSGKSALLANWALRYRKEYPEKLVLMHFIGATPSSSDWTVMLRRIMGEIKIRFKIKENIPEKPDELRSVFANWLNMAAVKGKIILVLDALNQLNDEGGAQDLTWLPPHIPENIRVFLSTLPGRPLEEIKKRGWPTFTIEALHAEEREQLIGEYLKLSSRALDKVYIARITGAKQCENPLFLRVLLDELQVFGVYEKLGSLVEHYLKAQSIPELYDFVLDRCERDYEQERPGLVRDVMSSLWGSRRGLSEIELMELLGDEGRPLPDAYWSPLHLAIEQSLLSRGGLIGFAHDFMRQAVKTRYLPEKAIQELAHLRLADYFEKKDSLLPRCLDELPWQIAEGKDWNRLYSLLRDLEFFDAEWKFNEFDVRTYWAKVEAESTLKMVDAYREVLDKPEQYNEYIWDIYSLLAGTGHLSESMKLCEYQIKYFCLIGDNASLRGALGNAANILFARGDLDMALALHMEEEHICRELGNMDGLQSSLVNQALIHQVRGDLEAAIELNKEAERICRDLGNEEGLQASLGNQAMILYDRGNLDGAMALHKDKERICRELGNMDGIRVSLANQAIILYDLGDLDGAMMLHKEEERICRDLGDKDGLQRTFCNQALILRTRGDINGAMALYKEEERICRELGHKDGLQRTLGNQALIIYARGDSDGAMAMYKEQELICRELAIKHGLQTSLSGQAMILKDWGDLDGAMVLNKETERICREMGYKDGLQQSFDNQASILRDWGDLDGAMALYKEAESLCRQMGNKGGLQRAIGSQALVLYDRGDLDGAMKLHKEEERICRELGDKDGLQTSLGNQAIILKTRGDIDGAMALYKESEQICRGLGYVRNLAATLINRALILYGLGDLDEAMKLNKESERIFRELGNKEGLQLSLGNQARILYDLGDLDGAMTLHKEEEHLCCELGNKNGLQESLTNQASILFINRDYDSAMLLFKEAERICRELGNKDGLKRALCGQAHILNSIGDPDGAIAIHKEQESICRELGDQRGLKTSLTNQASILFNRKDYGGALELYYEAECICRELGDKNGLQRILCDKAFIVEDIGDLVGAMSLFKEMELICRELGDKYGLQASLGNQATILKDLGDLEGALVLNKEGECICRELGDEEELTGALANQALILGNMNQFQKAISTADEALRLATRCSNKSLVNQVKNIRSWILTRMKQR